MSLTEPNHTKIMELLCEVTRLSECMAEDVIRWRDRALVAEDDAKALAFALDTAEKTICELKASNSL